MSSGIRRATRTVRMDMSTVATDTNLDDMKISVKSLISSPPFPDRTSGITPEVMGIEAARRVARAANILDSNTFLVKKPRSELETLPDVGVRVIM